MHNLHLRFGKNKRGWLRIFEAVIGIMLIASVVLYLSAKQKSPDNGEFIYSIQSEILQDFSRNESLKNAVFIEDNITLGEYAVQKIPNSYNFFIKICLLDDGGCTMDFFVDKDVFVSERIFASNLTDYKPLRVRLFMWEK
jgi:hypothetical protein